MVFGTNYSKLDLPGNIQYLGVILNKLFGTPSVWFEQLNAEHILPLLPYFAAIPENIRITNAGDNSVLGRTRMPAIFVIFPHS